MTKKNYKGSLRLDWINKDLSLYYEIDEKEGKGVRPVWVQKNDIRVAEPRILRFVKNYGDTTSENILIKGDNLLVLRSLVEMFKGKPDKEKVKCVYIDPPFNTGNAFEKYDDNLQHSEWLTFMRDRLKLLNKLLRKDGMIFVHIDDIEQGYLRVLMDEIFGRQNYLAQIAYQRSGAAGLGQGGKFVVNTTEYIVSYAKEKESFVAFEAKDAMPLDLKDMKRYKGVLKNEGTKKLVFEFKAKSNGLPVKIYKHLNFKIESISLSNFSMKSEEIYKEYVSNFDKIFRLNIPQKENEFQHDLISKMDDSLYSVEYYPSRGKKKGNYSVNHYYKRQLLAWLNSSAELEDGKIAKTNKLTDFWPHGDIPKADLANEGGVSFLRSKKPEQLIKRILQLSTSKGDLVLDSFAGSGTTGAVAHKMDRRWIMVEFGRHADELIVPRMQRVVDGKDQSGISKEINWKGGAGFKYYQLGDSVIYEQDMNWKLKAEEMAEAVFLHFQYRPIKAGWLEKENMYLGRHQSARYHFALSFASREVKIITEDLYEKIIAGLDKEKFKHLTIFTNVAVAVPPDSFDKEKILVKKIPAAILREYNLL
jgi:adenine-specific DNA-methyltransferase